MDDPRLIEIDELLREPHVDESRLADIVTSIGADPGGPRRLVERYGASKDRRVLGFVALVLSRAAWSAAADEKLEAVLLDLMAAGRGTSHPGTLISTLNAFHGLDASGSLHAIDPKRQVQLVAFLVECVEHPDINVRSAALDVFARLWLSGSLLRMLPGTSGDPLRRCLSQMAGDCTESDLERDLETLRDFWERV